MGGKAYSCTPIITASESNFKSDPSWKNSIITTSQQYCSGDILILFRKVNEVLISNTVKF